MNSRTLEQDSISHAIAIAPRWLVVGLALLLWCQSADGQDSCAGCHEAQSRSDSADLAEDQSTLHLRDWAVSAHGRSGVGCQGCHGGNPASFQPPLAHEGVLNSADPRSRTHYRNLPATCGSCHVDLWLAYRDGPHGRELEDGNRRVPTCVTCHGEVAAVRLGERGLRARCSRCHERGGPVDLVARGSELLSRYRELVDRIDRLERRIAALDDGALQHELREGASFVRDFLRQAIEAGHGSQDAEARHVLDSAEHTLAVMSEALTDR